MPLVLKRPSTKSATLIESQNLSPNIYWMEKILTRIVGNINRGALTILLPNGRTIKFNGSTTTPQATINLHASKSLKRLIVGGYLGLAEGYILGEWSTPSLSSLFDFGTANEEILDNSLSGNRIIALINQFLNSFRKNSLHGSKKNIAEHYDLGNEFFAKWLDPSFTYSSALFSEGKKQTLHEAQMEKFQRIVNRLNIKSNHRILEIGCGWGGFLEFTARNTGAHITALTISQEQYAYTHRRIRDAGLDGNVDVKLQDYRDHIGQYDRIVSIEMLEAVGEKYWPDYFGSVAKCLNKDGEAIIQAITVPDHKFEEYRGTVDFIQRFIFPGGLLISSAKIKEHCQLVNLEVLESHMFGQSYAQTLEIWREDFLNCWDAIKELGFDTKFKRMWEYYLTYTAAGFRANCTDVGQFHLSK